MKYILLTLLLAVTTASQADIRLTFKATQPKQREVVVIYNTTITPVALDSAGTGSVTLTDIGAVHGQIFYGQDSRNFFMEDGDDLTFTFNGSDFKGTLALEGPKARIFRYLNTIEYAVPAEADYAKPFADYKALVDAKEQAAAKLLAAWKLDRVSPRFARIEAGRLHYGYATNLMMYAAAHPMLTQQADWTPGDDYLAAVRENALTYQYPELAELRTYCDYMAEAARLLDPDAPRRASTYDRTLARMSWLADNVTNDTLRETLVNTLAVEYVDQHGTDSITELRNLQATYVTLPALQHAFNRACDAWDFSAPGKPSPEIKATGLDGRDVRLADFRGRYVFIDLWATWCGPCRVEFPHLRQLEADFKGRNIVFLGLSTDKNVDAWKKLAPTLSGVQAHIGPDSRFARLYRVEGIPRFILLDREGRIIDNNMTRPSDPATATALRALPGL